MRLHTENIIPLSAESDSPPDWRVPGVVEEVGPLGTETNLHIQMLGVQMIGKCEGHRRVEVKEQLNFELYLDHLHIFDADSEESLLNI